jgi:hypothetical protein
MMSESTPQLLSRVTRLLFIACFLSAALVSAAAQSSQSPKPGVPDDQLFGEDRSRSFAAVEEEMRAKRAIQVVDKEYQQNLDRARDLAFLGNSLAVSFKQKNTLDREDVKKLDRAEKLAKGIRHAAGGSDVTIQLEQAPNDLASALNRLEDLSKSLREKVEKTPKRVVSAAVIDEANVILELIRIARTLPPKV